MRKIKRYFKLEDVDPKFSTHKIVVKSLDDLNTTVAKNTKLKTVIDGVFNKKVATAGAVGAVAGGSAYGIWSFIKSNSGCFKKTGNEIKCKVKELSCCQKESVRDLPNCEGLDHLANVCENFDEDKENSCCRLCNCSTTNCEGDEEMVCQRPTIGDALTHFSKQVGSGLWSAIETIFPWASYVLYAFLSILALWLLSLAGPWINKLLPRRTAFDEDQEKFVQAEKKSQRV